MLKIQDMQIKLGLKDKLWGLDRNIIKVGLINVEWKKVFFPMHIQKE